MQGPWCGRVPGRWEGVRLAWQGAERADEGWTVRSERWTGKVGRCQRYGARERILAFTLNEAGHYRRCLKKGVWCQRGRRGKCLHTAGL